MNRYFINPLSQLYGWADPPPESPLFFHQKLPGYRNTPLHNSRILSDKSGFGTVLVKDESSRLTLPAFKILGASWAVYKLLIELLGHEPIWRNFNELRDIVSTLGPIKLVTATDGNHGRGVATVARWLGFEAKVFMPAGTVPARVEAIRNEGADVEVISGTYDEAVQKASSLQAERCFLVQDTSWPGYEKIPSAIIEGYSTLTWEIEKQLSEQNYPNPDAVIVPVGVGSLAASVIRHYRRHGITNSPVIIGVESNAANCGYLSLSTGKCISVPGNEKTIMAGLNCGTLASLAWPYLKKGMDIAISIDDKWAIKAMQLLAESSIISGESGAACTAALLALTTDPLMKPVLDYLSPIDKKCILIFSTEGITDPDAYLRYVHSGNTRFDKPYS